MEQAEMLAYCRQKCTTGDICPLTMREMAESVGSCPHIARANWHDQARKDAEYHRQYHGDCRLALGAAQPRVRDTV